MNFTIRQAHIHDLDLVAPLFDEYRQFYRNPPDLELAKRFLRERFEHNQSIVFVALDGEGRGVGFTQLYFSYSSGSAARILILNDLYVRPEARRGGVASRLLDTAAQFGRALGVVRLTLSTEFTNTAAQALYERHGWVRDTQFVGYTLAL